MMSRKRLGLPNPIYSKGMYAGKDAALIEATRSYITVLDYYRALANDNHDDSVVLVLDEIREKFSEKYNNLREYNIKQLRLSIQMDKEYKKEQRKLKLKEKANAI